jgi:phage-related minor tail protein|nr:MAG TPA_asm: minor tail protein [Caudoviricetes sp.]
MAKYSNTIVYNLQTNLDSRGIDTLRKKLSQVQTDLYKLKGMKGLTSDTKNNNALKLTDNKELEESYQTILKIQKALNSATNFSTGSFNTSTFLSDLQKMNVSAQNLVKTFSTTGVTGQQAFNQLSAALGSTEARVSRMSTTVTKMFNTLQNTVRWGITASIFETASNSVGRAVDYVKDLDKSLNEIRIISGYSAEDMNKFADSANKAAQALGKTTTEYTNASLIYIQQGKTLKESNSLANLTLKTANVTGQATAEVSEQLTSLMNGYQISVDNMEASVDKLAKVAAVSASDLEELATAESKVASTANALGVSQDQLVSQLSTIISVTRQAPESVGNAIN